MHERKKNETIDLIFLLYSSLVGLSSNDDDDNDDGDNDVSEGSAVLVADNEHSKLFLATAPLS